MPGFCVNVDAGHLGSETGGAWTPGFHACARVREEPLGSVSMQVGVLDAGYLHWC